MHQLVYDGLDLSCEDSWGDIIGALLDHTDGSEGVGRLLSEAELSCHDVMHTVDRQGTLDHKGL